MRTITLLSFLLIVTSNISAQSVENYSPHIYPSKQYFVTDYLQEGAGSSAILGFFFLDLDTDKDGKTDFFETGPNDDLDGDGLINSADNDDDNDGIPDNMDVEPANTTSMPASYFQNGTVAANNGDTQGDYWQFLPNSTITSGPLAGYFELPSVYLYIDNNNDQIPDALQAASGTEMPPYALESGFMTTHISLGNFSGLLGEWEYSGSPGSTTSEKSHLVGSTIFKLCDDDFGTSVFSPYSNYAPYGISDIYSNRNNQPDYDIYGTTNENDPAIPNSLKNTDPQGVKRWKYGWFGPTVDANREIVFFVTVFWNSGGNQVNTYYSRTEFNPDAISSSPMRNASTTGDNYGGSNIDNWFPHFQSVADHDQLAAAVFGAGTKWSDIASSSPNPVAINAANQPWVDQYENWTPERKVVQYLGVDSWLESSASNIESTINSRYGVDLNTENQSILVRAKDGKTPHFITYKPSQNSNAWLIGVEDLFGGGDREYADFNFYTNSIPTEITVLGNGMIINSDGSNSPSSANDTDFGDVCIGSGGNTNEFTIENPELADLLLTGNPKVSIAGAVSDFTVTTQPNSPVLGNTSTIFEIKFDPQSAGVKNATVTILNNDGDEGKYQFNLTGNGISAPNITTNNLDICPGETITLTASSVSGATYSWMGPNGFTSNNQNPIVTTNAVNSLHEGDYTVEVTVPGGCVVNAIAQVIIDNSPPTVTCKNATVGLDEFGNLTLSPFSVYESTSDNCAIEFLTVSPNSFDCNNLGVHTVTLTATDYGGNSDDCTAQVNIIDDSAPSVTCLNPSIFLDSNGSATVTLNDINGGISDGCGVEEIIFSPTNFDCSDLGSKVITLSVTDVNGNNTTCNSFVSIIDNIFPVAKCKDITIPCPQGQVTITPADIDDGSFDNCDLSLSLDQNVLTCSSTPVTVTLTASDNGENFHECTSQVTFQGQGGGLSISINDVSKLEGNWWGFTYYQFAVERTGGTTPISVQYATADGTAMVSNSDYIAKSGTLTWSNGGSNIKYILVQVRKDNNFESDEHFLVNLSNPTGGATISDNQGQGTIINDDAAPIIIYDNEAFENLDYGQQKLLKNEAVLFPNPTSDELHIFVPENWVKENTVDAILYDNTGRIVEKYLIENSEDIINVTSLRNGVYNLMFYTKGHGVVSERFIKID
jgi:hypothetical protein